MWLNLVPLLLCLKTALKQVVLPILGRISYYWSGGKPTDIEGQKASDSAPAHSFANLAPPHKTIITTNILISIHAKKEISKRRKQA
jgi:hypothetical protein